MSIEDQIPIIRKPIRQYPLPQNVKELDYPWPEEILNRYVRVPLFRDTYHVGSGDSPIVLKPNKGKSKLLYKL